MKKIAGLCSTVLLLLVLLAINASSVMADETSRVAFAKGQTGTVIKGALSGYDVMRYLVGASAGQEMTVSMTTKHPSAYFNVTGPGAKESLFIGASQGQDFATVLPSGGDWVVEVYLMRNAARRGEKADFRLSIAVTGKGAAVKGGDFADGDAGGPDFWQVSGVAADDALNIRSGPSKGYKVLARAANGAVLQNKGCRSTDGQRWCKVTTSNGQTTGWVNGRYLREAG